MLLTLFQLQVCHLAPFHQLPKHELPMIDGGPVSIVLLYTNLRSSNCVDISEHIQRTFYFRPFRVADLDFLSDTARVCRNVIYRKLYLILFVGDTDLACG